MNERIRQLDKQAKLWAMDNTNFPISSHIPAGYTEKFAELIVRECLVPLWSTECMQSDLALEEYNRNADKIKKHFGVEE